MSKPQYKSLGYVTNPDIHAKFKEYCKSHNISIGKVINILINMVIENKIQIKNEISVIFPNNQQVES